MLASEGYSLRVMLPETLTEEREEHLVVELWGPDGHPVEDDDLVLIFLDAGGDEHGVTAHPGAIPGRYEVNRRFQGVGTHGMRILPSDSSVDLRVLFEVSAEARTNS